jgi:hypothetical protein
MRPVEAGMTLVPRRQDRSHTAGRSAVCASLYAVDRLEYAITILLPVTSLHRTQDRTVAPEQRSQNLASHKFLAPPRLRSPVLQTSPA